MEDVVGREEEIEASSLLCIIEGSKCNWDESFYPILKVVFGVLGIWYLIKPLFGMIWS